MQVYLGILVCMHCMGAHGSAVYSSKRTYIRASNVAGLQRAVLDSVGEFQTLISPACIIYMYMYLCCLPIHALAQSVVGILCPRMQKAQTNISCSCPKRCIIAQVAT